MKIQKFLILFIIPILVLIISRTFSLSYTEEIKSIEIQSMDYHNPGSWHIDKSAEWTGFGKARVTFDVKSVMKTIDGRYKDVILIMDISGSMSGDKLDRAKQDAIDLTNFLLSNSNNRVALVNFASTSTVVSGFTNNKSQMIDYISNLSTTGCTNYNAGLLNIETVMENYVRDENKDLVVLFLTDGYPNEDTPNEKATYQMLKDKYPYMTINGIQYEMGKDIIQEIIDISDNQYIANIDTLNNVLFEATIVPISYDNFVIEDYIYDDYFYVDSANDIEVSFGTVTVENENGRQKITWNLGNNYVTGRNVKMNINLKLKEAYHNTRGLYPTNENEIIYSKLPEEVEKRTDSELTPVLLNVYNVIYETNTPDGCNLPSIPSEEHFVYQNVTMRNNELVCTGYIFKGWYISSNDLLDTKLINEEMFIMPNHDITIRGTWTKQDLVKTMDGIVKVKLDGTLMEHDSGSSKTFGKVINRDSFESITTVDDINIPANAIEYWDVSQERNGAVLAWYTDTDNNGKYELFIGQEDGVKANPNSSYAFLNFRNVETIDLSNFDISNVTNMSSMFSNAGYNAPTFELDLSNWNTEKVTSMSNMFSQAGYSATNFDIGNLNNWDTSNVTNMTNMFFLAGYRATTWDIGDLSNWNTEKVTNMSSMFSSAGYSANTFDIGDLSNWNTEKVTNMSSMFYQAGYSANTFDIGDLSNWDTSQVANMSSMFSYAGYRVTTWDIGDLSTWDVSSVTTMSNMFNNAGYNATTWNIGDLSNWNISMVTNMNSTFAHSGFSATTWNIGNLDNWDTSNVTTMTSMFERAGCNATTWNIGDISNWNTSNVIYMNYTFSNTGYNATSWNIGNLSNWDTSKVLDMSYMFESAGYKAPTINLNLSNWDVSSVTTMFAMFVRSGYSATTFDIGNLDNWDVSNVTNMSAMFERAGYYSTTWNVGNLSDWNISNVTSMSYMFYGVGFNDSLWSIGDLSNWDTSNVTTMASMFEEAGYHSGSFNIGNLGNWDTSKVTNMSNMFARAGYSATTWNIGDLSNWDTSKVTDMTHMFNNAGYSATIWNIGDLSNWDTSKVTKMIQMFYYAGYNATTWNSIGTLKVYAPTIDSIFFNCVNAKATLNIYSNPTSYDKAFKGAAIDEGSGITVNYSSATTNIDDIIATKSNNSNVVKGVQLD